MKAKFSYQTLTTPPPYAFGYTLELELSAAAVKVQYELEYLNRDELTEEEILSEGFTPDDNYSWSGELGKVWAELLSTAIDKLQLNPASEDVDIWLHAEVQNGKSNSGLVSNLPYWDYQLQELIQAIYEKAQREYPLNVMLSHKSDEGETRYKVAGSFEHRSASINQKEISWDALQDLMQWIFDIDESKNPAKKPNKNGLWIDIDGNKSWYLIAKKNQEILSILQ